jgi:hypothetical protein
MLRCIDIAALVNNLSEGWTALSGGSEQEAWAIFEQELEAGGSAEALEGLSWAAWWLDGADTLWPSAAISATRSPARVPLSYPSWGLSDSPIPRWSTEMTSKSRASAGISRRQAYQVSGQP